MQTIAITDAIKTLAEAERRFGLVRCPSDGPGPTEDDDFFPEWQVGLPELSIAEKSNLDDLRRRYLYQRSEGQLLEGTVTLLLVAPLLTVAGFYDPPFRVRAEESVQLTLEDSEEILQGRIDVLVLLNRLWVVVLESKKTALSVWTALPQTLAYLRANPQPERSSFAIVTNGDEVLFVKLRSGDRFTYAVSRMFSPFASSRELYRVLQVLKQMGAIVSRTAD
jgi:Type I restriction enzyme R protein N terminus (HSDR_N)